VARINPLTYQVDALRALMVQGAHGTLGLGLDLGVEAGVLAGLVVLAARLYTTAIT